MTDLSTLTNLRTAIPDAAYLDASEWAKAHPPNWEWPLSEYYQHYCATAVADRKNPHTGDAFTEAIARMGFTYHLDYTGNYWTCNSTYDPEATQFATEWLEIHPPTPNTQSDNYYVLYCHDRNVKKYLTRDAFDNELAKLGYHTVWSYNRSK